MELDSGFCVNCGSASGSMVLHDDRILNCIRLWTAPQLVQNHDLVCTVCWNAAYRTFSNSLEHSLSIGERKCALCNHALPTTKRAHQVIALRMDTQHHVNIKNIILERRLMPLQVRPSHFICHPCWQRADRAARRYSIPSTSTGTSSSSSQLKCANCGINVMRMRRHILNDENILHLVQQQASPRVVTSTDYICRACHNILNERNVILVSHDSSPLVGHQNICAQCGRSLAQVRTHTVQGSDHICHRCFQRAQSSAAAVDDTMLDAPASDPLSQQAEIITLPNYSRPPDTHAQCIFPRCNSTSQQMVPFIIRVRLFSDHKYYIPPGCRICSSHIETQSWSDLFEAENILNSFTAAHIEDFCELLKNDKNIIADFNNIDAMDDHLVWYWLGCTKLQFRELITELPDFQERNKALGAYLMKLRTGHSDDRIATLLNMGRSTLTKLLNKARDVMVENFVPQHLGLNHITRRGVAERNIYS